MRQSVSTVVIEPEGKVPNLGLAELREYSELFFFLVWRDIKGRYAQSVLGIGWAIVQPVMAMVVFTVIFGNLAEIASDGIPYSIFSYTGLVAWTYYSNALSDSTGSLVTNANMLQKIYFPRLILPLSAVLARMVDFVISLGLLVVMMLWYGITPTWWALGLPCLVLVLMISAAGLGMFLGAMAVQYRDVKHAMGFGIRLLMYAAPVVYPLSYVPEQFHLAYAVNPMVGVVEGFRASLLGTTAMPWNLIAVSSVSGVIMLLAGAWYFRKKEHVFADVG
jgi:lipopolysaccharide transport system permease protein